MIEKSRWRSDVSWTILNVVDAIHAESVRWLIMRFRSNWIIEAAPCFSSFHSSSSESSRPPSSNHDVSHLSASLSLCLYPGWCSPRILCSFVSFVVSRISKESADRWFVADSADRSGLMGGPYLWMALQHQWDALVSFSYGALVKSSRVCKMLILALAR